MTAQRCAEILTHIAVYLDGELPPAACSVIEEHCAECASCSALVAGLRETVGLCRQAAGVPLPNRVRARALDSVRKLLKT